MATTADTLVLVTGGSGFVGAHCAIALLNADYKVRTTIRSLKKQEHVHELLRNGGIADSLLEHLSIVAADLTKDEGWADAVNGCTYILHVASPFPSALPKHEDDLIVPAREGTLRVLRAAKNAGVQRVVITSSFAAIGYGHPPQKAPFTEKDWTNLKGAFGSQVPPYMKSKTLAERAAWDYVKSEEGKGLELAVVNPVGIFGPVLGADYSTSIIIVQRVLSGDVPGLPHISFGAVDVRDLAELEILAMTHEKAAGERFIGCADGQMTFKDLAVFLKGKFPAYKDKIKTMTVPNMLMRVLALFDKEIASVVNELGVVRDSTSEKARTMLGWRPRSWQDSVTGTAESLIKYKLVKHG